MEGAKADSHPSKASLSDFYRCYVQECERVHAQLHTPMGNMMGILLNLQTSNTFATLPKEMH